MNNQKIAHLLFGAGFVVCLLYIWLPGYFITGDGPCHVYNAQVLHDLWCNKNTAFYSRFYTVVYQPNPNWLSTVAIALLLLIVNGIIAEKIFLTVYVVVYVGGFYLLLSKISKAGPYFLLAIFIFVFPQTLSKGFYNFSFSIAFYFWVVWAWLGFLDKKNIGTALLFLLFTSFIFFTHLLAFIFAAVTCAALLLSYAIARESMNERKLNWLFKNALMLLLLLSPFIVLMNWFTNKEGGMQLQPGFHPYRLLELLQCKYLVNVVHTEDLIVLIAGVTIMLLFGFCALRFKEKLSINKYDGLLLGLLFVLFVYLVFPESFLGKLILISMRVQVFVLLLIVCSVAYLPAPAKVKTAGALVLFACFIGVSIARISCLIAASPAVADYVSAQDRIKPYAVVLPLDFSPNGIDEHGKIIADRNFLFYHASQYMGTSKPMIILDNYEANMGYFPVCWTDNTNPYKYLSRDGGLEATPPSASIAGYKQSSGVTVDYILMWCYNPSFLQNEHFRELYVEVNAGYHLAYTSASGRTTLFERNVTHERR